MILLSGVFMILMGMLGKIGAIFTTIPTPVLGGMFLIMFGVITATGISNLQVNNCTESGLIFFPNTWLLFRVQHVSIFQSTDMNSSRNIFIFGFSMFTALVIPNWILKNPDFFKTGTTCQQMSLFFNSFHLDCCELT